MTSTALVDGVISTILLVAVYMDGVISTILPVAVYI